VNPLIVLSSVPPTVSENPTVNPKEYAPAYEVGGYGRKPSVDIGKPP
jgi:hypothetical protein